MAGAAGKRRPLWQLAVRLSAILAAAGVLFLVIGDLLAALIAFLLGASCAAAAAVLLRRDHGGFSDRP